MKHKGTYLATLSFAIVVASQLISMPDGSLARASVNRKGPEIAESLPSLEPQGQCDSCKPRVSTPTVRYLRHNGSQHEVEVNFTFGLPSCFGSQPRPDFRVVIVQLNFPNGVRRERINAGVGEGGACTGGAGTCKTLVRVSGPASDGRPTSYFASVEASIPIHGYGLSGNNVPF